MGKRANGKISLGCLFWGLFILLMVALFIFNKDTIIHVLEKTNAKNILSGKNTETGRPTEPLSELRLHDDTAAGAESKGIDASGGTEQSMSEPPRQEEGMAPDVAEAPEEGSPSVLQNADGAIASGDDPAGGAAQTEAAVPEPIEPDEDADTLNTISAIPIQKEDTSKEQQLNTGTQRPAEMRNAMLYWIRIDGDGKLTRQRSVRSLPKSDTPLSDVLEALFALPSNDELKQGLRTLIPPGTQLRATWVKDGVAFINVSEEFQFNQYGIEGALGQLSQVVFTATEFPTVKTVQILIEGQKKDYLGAEGVWIGSPLARVSF